MTLGIEGFLEDDTSVQIKGKDWQAWLHYRIFLEKRYHEHKLNESQSKDSYLHCG